MHVAQYLLASMYVETSLSHYVKYLYKMFLTSPFQDFPFPNQGRQGKANTTKGMQSLIHKR